MEGQLATPFLTTLPGFPSPREFSLENKNKKPQTYLFSLLILHSLLWPYKAPRCPQS